MMDGLIHNNPRFHIITVPEGIAAGIRSLTKGVGRPPRQRTSDPDHKLSVQETAMADKPNTRIPSEPQRYARPVPIGEVARKLITDLSKKDVE